MDSKKKYILDTDELAVPEIHLEEGSETDDSGNDGREIDYEPLAMPELHIKRMLRNR